MASLTEALATAPVVFRDVMPAYYFGVGEDLVMTLDAAQLSISLRAGLTESQRICALDGALTAVAACDDAPWSHETTLDGDDLWQLCIRVEGEAAGWHPVAEVETSL